MELGHTLVGQRDRAAQHFLVLSDQQRPFRVEHHIPSNAQIRRGGMRLGTRPVASITRYTAAALFPTGGLIGLALLSAAFWLAADKAVADEQPPFASMNADPAPFVILQRQRNGGNAHRGCMSREFRSPTTCWRRTSFRAAFRPQPPMPTTASSSSRPTIQPQPAPYGDHPARHPNRLWPGAERSRGEHGAARG